MAEQLISVGIDIGTTTTQVIFSTFTIVDRANFFSSPNIEIADKKMIYYGRIYFTPLLSDKYIDAKGVRDIVEKEYLNAGIHKDQVKTGAVIITGETARKENAKAVLMELSSFAGDFVVSTAGPDLESVIAGKGSGACEFSRVNNCSVVNLDIGGGTTNIALFSDGKTIAKTCLDIGGRLIRGSLGEITYISPVLKKYKDQSPYEIARLMSDALLEAIGVKEDTGLSREFLTAGSSPIFIGDKGKSDFISFSGGVADLIGVNISPFTYGDIGDLLGQAIFQNPFFPKEKWVKTKETIRATVIGAGMHTTEISGSTITNTGDILPLKNIPVFYINVDQMEELKQGNVKTLTSEVEWFCSQRDTDVFLFSFQGEKSPKYTKLKEIAYGFKLLYDELGKGIMHYEGPIILVLYEDYGKVLGQLLDNVFSYKRDILCIDKIVTTDGDYVDFGKSLMGGMVIPVVVKTLLFP